MVAVLPETGVKWLARSVELIEASSISECSLVFRVPGHGLPVLDEFDSFE